MNIFFPLGAFYPSQIGGPCNTLYWHTLALHRNSDIAVTIVTTTKGIEKGKVPHHVFRELEYGKIYYGGKDSTHLNTILVCFKEIKNSDIIHLNSLFNPLSIFSFFYSKIFYPRKKIVWSVRGETHPSALKYSFWKKIPLIFLNKNLCDNVLFHSTSQAETGHIKKIFNESRIDYMPNLIQPSPRYLTPKMNKLLFMGRIHPIKAIDKLLIALSMSSIFIKSDFILDIVGKYEDRHRKYFEYLMQLIQEHGLEEKVIFSGHLTGEAKVKKYAESYFLILPSESENFGNVVIEAMNQGTPAIASKGTPWQILESAQAGFYCENKPEILARVIDEALTMPTNKYEKLCENSKILVHNEFDVNKNIDRWIDCYKNLYNAEEQKRPK